MYPILAEKAAALSFSLVKNHAFVNGNKRIGWSAMRVFLLLNGHGIEAAGKTSREDWTNWVITHLKAR